MDNINMKDCIKALRNGTVPAKGLGSFFVGHDEQLKELLRELDGILKSGGSSVRFLLGDYGSGKTMLTAYLMEKALENNFAVSQVIIDPGVQLGNFEDVYRSFCQNVRTPQSGDGSGVVNLLENWVSRQLQIFQKVDDKEGTPLDPLQIRAFATHIETELVSVRNLDPILSRAITAYATAKVERKHDLSTYALNWIRASDKVSSRDYSKELGLKGKIGGDDAYKFLKGLLFLIRDSGLAGTLFVLDEVETVRRLPQKPARQKAYEIIRHILDDSGANKFSYTLFLINATREFFESTQGIKEYSALEKRIENPKKAGEVSIKQPIITLHRLEENNLAELALKIRKIHGLTEEWNIQEQVPDIKMPALTRYVGRTFTDIESDPRRFIRELINIFDKLKEKPELKVHEMISAIEESDG